MTDEAMDSRERAKPVLTQEQFETWASRFADDVDRRLQGIEQRPQFLQRTTQDAQARRQPVVMRERAQEPQNSAESTEWKGQWVTNIGVVVVGGLAAVAAIWKGQYDLAQTILGLTFATAGATQIGYTASRSYTKAKTGKTR